MGKIDIRAVELFLAYETKMSHNIFPSVLAGKGVLDAYILHNF